MQTTFYTTPPLKSKRERRVSHVSGTRAARTLINLGQRWHLVDKNAICDIWQNSMEGSLSLTHTDTHTGWANWTLLRKWKYFICCLKHLFLFLVGHHSNSIWNTSISGVKSSCTSLYTKARDATKWERKALARRDFRGFVPQFVARETSFLRLTWKETRWRD